MPLPDRRRGYPSAIRAGDPTTTRPKDVWLYVVQCGPFVKVGLASDMKKRLREFAGQNPFDVVCLAKSSVRADKASYAERRAHEILADFHHRGEWFKADAADAVRAVRRAADWALRVRGPWDDACAEYQAAVSEIREADWLAQQAAQNVPELEAMAAGEG